MSFSPEGLIPSNETESIISHQEQDESATAELAGRYTIPSPSSIAAITLATVIAAGTGEASAQTQSVEKIGVTNTQVEAVERRIQFSATVEHPTEGTLSIALYYKMVDLKKPVFGSRYELVINDQVREVIEAQFLRNGAGFFSFKSAAGQIERVIMPDIGGRSRGVTINYHTADGQVIPVNRTR